MSLLEFYYIDESYIKYLKNAELEARGFTCVPNVHYWNTDKFFFGTVLQIDKNCYFVPVTSYAKKQEDAFLLRDKQNKVLGSLRFNYMIPVPKECLMKVDINSLPTEYNKVHTSKELACCRRNRERIFKRAEKTYERVISGLHSELLKNSCDFKLLEQKCQEYIQTHQQEQLQILPNELPSAQDFGGFIQS